MERSKNVQEFLSTFTKKAFGKSLDECQGEIICVVCHGPADVFDDEESMKEYQISGLCQKCQDKTFK